MNQCMQCGTEMIVKLENRPYAGLPGVMLCGIRVYHCPKCGDYEVEIPRPDDLHRLLAALMVTKQARLVHQERRFLRNFLGWTEEELATRMGVALETVARWEADEDVMGPVEDRLLRLLVTIRLPGISLSDEVLGLISDRAAPVEVVVKADDRGWREAA